MLAALAAVVGEAHLETAPEALARAGTATFATRQSVAAIVAPGDREQLQACVRLANRHGVPLYPVSRGRNWGYGSRVPTADGAILLSLARLDGIDGYDETLGIVSVEPGVSFAGLRAFLRARGSRLMLNAPGSTPEASVIGNTVERGIVQGPQPDRAAAVCGLEVVLPDGACIRGGMAALPGARAAAVHRWGLGPSLDGLFLQSNLGIVTRMTLWLEPLPARFRHLHFTLARDADLEPALRALQRLRLEGSIATSIGLHNGEKILSLSGRYPFAATGGATPLPEAERRAVLDALGGGAWFGELAISAASDAGLQALERHLEAELVPAIGTLSWSAVNAPGPFFAGLENEQPSGLSSVYWRKASPPGLETAAESLDPDRDRCGVIWHAPALPFEPSALRRCADIVERLLPAGGFEPILSFQALDGRCVLAVISILYDREVAGEDARAADCARALAAALDGEGFYPYRLGLLGQDDPPAPDPETAELRRRLKRMLDPKAILAPGRYEPGAAGADEGAAEGTGKGRGVGPGDEPE